jgi:hypothetical protein
MEDKALFTKVFAKSKHTKKAVQSEFSQNGQLFFEIRIFYHTDLWFANGKEP